VCPGCRCVFRVPKEHDGKGVVCPACKVMLRLPGPEEDPGPLVIHREKSPVAIAQEEEEHDHDHDHEEEKDSTLRLILMMAVPGVLLLGLFAWLLMKDEGGAAKSTADAAPAPEAVDTTPAATEKPVAARPPSDFIQMETVAKSFLEAPTLEQALRWVHRPEEVKPKAEAWYAAEPYVAAGFKGTTDETNSLDQNGLSLTGLGIRTGNFDKREIVLVKMPEGYRVDWESWAGWSEMSWADFKKQRPTEAKLFRVVCSPTVYYNFGFKDESRWVSFRLDSPDGLDFLYGYAPAGSELSSELRPVDGVKKRSVILMLKFPPDAATDNQVIIESVTGEGWLDLPESP